MDEHQVGEALLEEADVREREPPDKAVEEPHPEGCLEGPVQAERPSVLPDQPSGKSRAEGKEAQARPHPVKMLQEEKGEAQGEEAGDPGDGVVPDERVANEREADQVGPDKADADQQEERRHGSDWVPRAGSGPAGRHFTG
jgi:hypothetical protein